MKHLYKLHIAHVLSLNSFIVLIVFLSLNTVFLIVFSDVLHPNILDTIYGFERRTNYFLDALYLLKLSVLILLVMIALRINGYHKQLWVYVVRTSRFKVLLTQILAVLTIIIVYLSVHYIIIFVIYKSTSYYQYDRLDLKLFRDLVIIFFYYSSLFMAVIHLFRNVYGIMTCFVFAFMTDIVIPVGVSINTMQVYQILLLHLFPTLQRNQSDIYLNTQPMLLIIIAFVFILLITYRFITCDI